MGNPHAVQVVDDVERAPVTTQGPLIEHHPRFPQRVNAGYMQLAHRASHVEAARLGARRGRDARLRHRAPARRWWPASAAASSTPRCASTTRGGDLMIRWNGGGSPVMMTGDAVRVFDGELEI